MVLFTCVDFIISNIVATETDFSIDDIFSFVDDRFRSIRQDFNIAYSISPIFRTLKESIIAHE